MLAIARVVLVGLVVVTTAVVTMSVLAMVGNATSGRGAGQVEFLLIALPLSAAVGYFVLRRTSSSRSVGG